MNAKKLQHVGCLEFLYERPLSIGNIFSKEHKDWSLSYYHVKKLKMVHVKKCLCY